MIAIPDNGERQLILIRKTLQKHNVFGLGRLPLPKFFVVYPSAGSGKRISS